MVPARLPLGLSGGVFPSKGCKGCSGASFATAGSVAAGTMACTGSCREVGGAAISDRVTMRAGVIGAMGLAESATGKSGEIG